MLKDFENANVGNVTEVEVGGLKNLTSYYYTVRGINGEGKMSLVSPEMLVVTGTQSGLGEAAISNLAVRADAGTIVVSGATAGIRLYSVDGRLVAATAAGEASFRGLSRGVYIVVSGADTVKVAL